MPVFYHAGGANICFDSKEKVSPCLTFVGNSNNEQSDLMGGVDYSVLKRFLIDFLKFAGIFAQHAGLLRFVQVFILQNLLMSIGNSIFISNHYGVVEI